MAPTVLIASHPADLHAFAVTEAIRLKQADVLLWHTSDFPGNAHETIRFKSGGQPAMNLGSLEGELCQESIRTFWLRRPEYVLDESALHSADLPFAKLQARFFRDALLELICADAFQVNPRHAAKRANNKIIQQQAAMKSGFSVPETVYTNDPDAIRRLLRKRGNKVIYKPLWPMQWQRGEVAWHPFTALVDEGHLMSEGPIENCPGIYQERVSKAYELRITVIGETVFGARISSQETESGKLDWRRAYEELAIEPFDVPDEMSRRCIDLLRRLGLVFGCFDVVVTPQGEWVFLEVNHMGQFLFVERICGLPLLDAFAEFLLAGVPSFRWSPHRNQLRLSDVWDATDAALERALERHVRPRDRALSEPAETSSSG